MRAQFWTVAANVTGLLVVAGLFGLAPAREVAAKISFLGLLQGFVLTVGFCTLLVWAIRAVIWLGREWLPKKESTAKRLHSKIVEPIPGPADAPTISKAPSAESPNEVPGLSWPPRTPT